MSSNQNVNQREIRLELVKLCHRHDHTSEQIIAKVKELEAYVSGPSEKQDIEVTAEVSKKRRHKSHRVVDNVDILS